MNEDHLFRVCRILEFSPDETDFLLLLRASEATQEPDRKNNLNNKIEALRRTRTMKANVQEFRMETLSQELDYLFDPYCVIVHVFLTIDLFKKNPYKISTPLGLSTSRLEKVFKKLHSLGFINWDSEKNEVVEIYKSHFHYSTEHPLMRAHQLHLKQLCESRLQKILEMEGTQFMVTFSGSKKLLDQVNEEFQSFIQRVKDRSKGSPKERAYQLNFELFPWT